MIQLFAGLGNPGSQYTGTRHNAGFRFIDELSRQLGVSLQLEKNYAGELATCRLGSTGQKLWLLKPMTFMNRSGQSVAALARFFKIPPESICIVHDELDLEPGRAKLKFGGGHGGHNGLRDIHSKLGTPEYWRLRLGIGHPGVRSEVTGWVLQKPRTEDRNALEECIWQASVAVPHMTGYNTRSQAACPVDMQAATREINTVRAD